MDMIWHGGGCHCGRVRIEVLAPARIRVAECNCSICSKSGYLHLIVSRDCFRVVRGEDSVTAYTFNTRTARHLFCSHCGIKAYYVPRSHPDGISVNARCIDSSTVQAMTIEQIDGRDWESQYPAGQGEFESE
ncbi:MAG: GFA family protein [Candidatus Binatia bacterium]